MFGTQHLALFVVSGLLLNITPGADSLFIASRSMAHGVRAGVAAALGVGAGCCLHAIAAALGLSAVLAASGFAFTAVKLVGAAYLVYLGLTLLRARPTAARIAAAGAGAKAEAEAEAPLRTVFAQGFLTNALNPKVALFFLAFVPQFIEPSAPHKALAFLFLGAVFNINGTLWGVCLAWLAARFGAFGSGTRAAAWLGRGVGAFFVFLGVRLALSEPG